MVSEVPSQLQPRDNFEPPIPTGCPSGGLALGLSELDQLLRTGKSVRKDLSSTKVYVLQGVVPSSSPSWLPNKGESGHWKERISVA